MGAGNDLVAGDRDPPRRESEDMDDRSRTTPTLLFAAYGYLGWLLEVIVAAPANW